MLQNVEQKEIHPMNGMIMLILNTVGLIVSVGMTIVGGFLLGQSNQILGGILFIVGLILIVVFSILYRGLRVVGPNEALVLTLFGKYYGTILKEGYYYVNPFASYNNPIYSRVSGNRSKIENNDKSTVIPDITPKKTVSLKSITLNNGTQKVNDVLGNPIIIGAVVIWKVADPTKAVFNVDNYAEFLSIQTDSTIRNIARQYPYDDLESEDDNTNEKTLRSSSLEIANDMKAELIERVQVAGLDIEEVRITHLAYSEEIAASMLQRQQASAVIAAKQKIVDGAVGMVKMAIDKLGEDEIVVLDEERKAAMVSNLLVVLCANKDTQPVVNSGSIY